MAGSARPSGTTRVWGTIQAARFGRSSYVVAPVLVGLTLLVRALLNPGLDLDQPYLQFFPAILIAAWYGGLGPGALATALSAISAMFLSLPFAGAAIDAADVISLGLFVVAGLGISWLNHQLHEAEIAQRASAALAAARAERLDAIINTTVDGIIVIDSSGAIEAFNRGAQRLFGYSESEVVGRNVTMLMPSPYREDHDRYIERYLTTGEARIIGMGRQVTARRRDGSVFPVHLSVGEMIVDGKRKFTGMLHDLTARVQLEDQLREQAALARIGEMAAVIAHEVKNPLAGVRGAIQVLATRQPPGSSDALMMKEIVARIDSLDEMVNDLLLFARPPTPRRRPTEVAPLLAATANLLARDPVLHDIKVEIDGSAPPIPADAEMLKIVFQNLLVNAAHAMQGHGRILVAVKVQDGTCRIAFTDAGPGIPPDIREKIFTPFFTTKSRGTGLGLPTAKRIVEAHQGRISIDFPPAGGTTVVVQLPLEAS